MPSIRQRCAVVVTLLLSLVGMVATIGTVTR